MKYIRFAICALAAVILSGELSAFAQPTTITYQGSIYSSGVALNGTYSMQFTLKTAASSGTTVGTPIVNSAVGVTNGLFTTTLDFGNIFYNSPLYLEIGVKTNGSGAGYAILSPAQAITSAPYAIQAINAGTASFVSGAITDAQLSTNVANFMSNGVFTKTITFSNATGNFSGTFTGTGVGTFTGFFNGTNTGTFIGNGGLITNINATNLLGVVQGNPNWQIVQSSPQQAAVANNYLFTNNTQQSLILPASPNVGNTVWISGAGAAGWKLTQNASQSILTVPLGLPAGQLWTSATASTSQAYKGVSSSDDGLKLAAAVGTGVICYSGDGGNTWANSDSPNQFWYGIASSSDGSRLAAAGSSSHIYTSTNGGTNWTATASPIATYKCVATSANGFNIYGGESSGYIQSSSDGGTNWTSLTTAANANWTGIACSKDASTVVAVGGSTRIYVSQNYGTTFATNGPASAVAYNAVACSDDGQSMIAGGANTLVVSGDGGNTWVQRVPMSVTWTAVACSSNGAVMLAAYSTGYIYISTDRGVTWNQVSNGYTSAKAWTALACNADASRIIGGISTDKLWLSAAATTVGTGGYLQGNQYSNVQLQYIGGGLWMPLSFSGAFKAY